MPFPPCCCSSAFAVAAVRVCCALTFASFLLCNAICVSFVRLFSPTLLQGLELSNPPSNGNEERGRGGEDTHCDGWMCWGWGAPELANTVPMRGGGESDVKVAGAGGGGGVTLNHEREPYELSLVGLFLAPFYTYLCMSYTCICVYVCVCSCVYIYGHVYIYLYIYIY